MSMRAYIAAPIFNDHQRSVVDEIKEVLEEANFNVFSPYHHSQEIFKGRKPSDCSPEERRQVLIGNIENIAECPLMVAWVGGKSSGHDASGVSKSVDTGVVWELGFMAALSGAPAAFGNPPNNERLTIAYLDGSDEDKHMNLMLAGTVDAACIGILDLKMALAQLKLKGPELLQQAGWHPDKVLGALSNEPLV